jgi:hypothetical protein
MILTFFHNFKFLSIIGACSQSLEDQGNQNGKDQCYWNGKARANGWERGGLLECEGTGLLKREQPF